MLEITESSIYIDELIPGKQVLIDCDPKIWQYVFWHSVLAIHHENYIGGFYLSDDSVLIEHMIEAGWETYDSPSDEFIRTDYVIPVDKLWLYIEKQLTLLGVSYDSKSNFECESETNDIGLREAVIHYMKFLTNRGYVVDLHSKMGHEDEHSYKLIESDPK